jgi:hypothetical protein
MPSRVLKTIISTCLFNDWEYSMPSGGEQTGYKYLNMILGCDHYFVIKKTQWELNLPFT